MDRIRRIFNYYRRGRAVTLLWHHGLLFGAAVIMLITARATFAPGVPLFWPILIWYVIFSLHFLLVRSLTANDEWADERADKVRRHAYDFQHVKDIYIKPTTFETPTGPSVPNDEPEKPGD